MRLIRQVPFLVFLLLISPLVHFACEAESPFERFNGTFYANDCGESHGGFEWAGEYSARLEISGDEGTLEVLLTQGIGDPLQKHLYSVRHFAEAGGNMSFTLEGRSSQLIRIDNDSIWDGRFNSYYTGTKSANPAERIGKLPIEIFEGLRPHYYIELRLKPAEQEPHLFFSHR